MADPLPNEDPDVIFDAAALEKMSSAQIADMLNSMIAAFEVRLAKLEQPRVGAEAQQIDIDTDDTIDMQQIGNKFNLAVDLDQVRQQGGAFGGGGGTAVAGWTFDSQTGMGCLELDNCNFPYAVITRYRLEPPSTTVIVSVRIEVANCPYVPCIPAGSSSESGNPPVTAHIWRRCTAGSESGEQPGDLLLSPEVLALGLSTFDEPVVQLTSDGPCYQFFGITTGHFTNTDVMIIEGCDNEACSTCDCDATCIRVTDENDDWIEISVDGEDHTFCNYSAFSVTRGGPNGGLESIELEWVDDAWVITVIGPASAWTAVYNGGDSGCPSATISKVSGSASAPATLTVTDCESVCVEGGPSEVFIPGFGDGFLGTMKVFVDPDCEVFSDPDVGQAPLWDGVFANKVGDCEWHIAGTPPNVYYKNADGTITSISSGIVKIDATATPPRWEMQLQMGNGVYAANLRWGRGGDGPDGDFGYNGDLLPERVFTNPACYVVNQTITIASTP